MDTSLDAKKDSEATNPKLFIRNSRDNCLRFRLKICESSAMIEMRMRENGSGDSGNPPFG